MITVSPTILVANAKEFEGRVRAIEPFFTRAQIDVLNNTLVSSASFADPEHIESLKTHLTFEVDLMVNLNGYNLSQWNKPWVDMIAIHVEAVSDLDEYIKVIKSWGKQVFLSLNPETEISTVEPWRASIDGVLFMTVDPGRSGNPFKYEVITRIEELRAKDSLIEIEADGGITPVTLPPLLEAGVTRVAVGSFLQSKYIEERSLELLAIIERAHPVNT